MRLHQFQDLRLLLRLCIRRDREVVEGDVVGSRKRGEVGVVGYDQGHLDAELVRGLAEEEVVEAVADLGDHDHDAGLLREGTEREGH